MIPETRIEEACVLVALRGGERDPIETGELGGAKLGPCMALVLEAIAFLSGDEGWYVEPREQNRAGRLRPPTWDLRRRDGTKPAPAEARALNDALAEVLPLTHNRVGMFVVPELLAIGLKRIA